jgi:hypothetical protein
LGQHFSLQDFDSVPGCQINQPVQQQSANPLGLPFVAYQ